MNKYTHKLLIVLLIVSLLSLGVSILSLVEHRQIAGDMNGDGKVTITDLVKLSRNLAGLE